MDKGKCIVSLSPTQPQLALIVQFWKFQEILPSRLRSDSLPTAPHVKESTLKPKQDDSMFTHSALAPAWMPHSTVNNGRLESASVPSAPPWPNSSLCVFRMNK